MMHLGIDYGAKLAGTTAICWEVEGRLNVSGSKKNQDADAFLMDSIQVLKPTQIFIDAPLSLPGAYFGKTEDFHFREADRQVSAMSPMFLGGLTARAMSLRSNLPDVLFFETYPRELVRILDLKEHYKVDPGLFLSELGDRLPYPLDSKSLDWHQVDAVLAWLSGWRFRNDRCKVFGHSGEGMIWV